MKRSEQFPEVRDIADAVCEGCATEDQLAKLEQLLRGDFDAQHFYYDYINMNAQLSDSPGRNTEITYRRMTEEVVVRSNPNPPVDDTNKVLENAKTPQSPYKISKRIFLSLLILIGIIISLLWIMVNRNTTPFVAHLIDGDIVSVGQGKVVGNELLAGDYRSVKEATIKLLDGDIFHLTPKTTVKIFNNREIKLKLGKLTLEALSQENTIVHTRSFILQSKGSDLSVELVYPAPIVTSGENTILSPLRWRPKHFWNFNGQGDRIVDAAGSAYGVVGSGATRVKGLVGQGAFMFDNSANAHIELGSGGGTVPGSGSFAVTDGVTIEALIRSADTDKLLGLDDIFCKNSADGEPRVLLSFRHDKAKNKDQDNLNSEATVTSSLNFGLYILGQGYFELTLPLDGRDGRPSLAELTDGNYHHIVGTYDTATGVKAIYIDGERRAFYQHPPGSAMVSGGSGQAVIGNIVAKDSDQNLVANSAAKSETKPATKSASKSENNKTTSGVIDEVTFYDFALGDLMIKQHLLNIKQGYNYYGLAASTDTENIALPQRLRLTLLPNTTFEMVPRIGLPAKIVDKAD